MGVAPSPVGYGPGNVAINGQAGLIFNNSTGPSILTGTVDPTSVATAGVAGSFYLNSSTGKQYAKQDNGSTTNWKIVTGVVSAVTLSASCGSVVFGGGGPTADANLTLTITTSGNPVYVGLQPDGGSNQGYLAVAAGGTGYLYIYRDGVSIAGYVVNSTTVVASGGFWFLDAPSAGSHTYQIYYQNVTNNFLLQYLKLAAYELGAGVAAGGSSGITRIVSSISSPTTAGAVALTDYVYLVSGTTTLTLPTAVGNTNRYSVTNVGSNTVTVATTSSQTINGSSTATLPIANMSLDFISDGSNWRVE